MVDASGHDAVEWVLRMLGEAIGHPLVPVRLSSVLVVD
jgi:hypothetical protein